MSENKDHDDEGLFSKIAGKVEELLNDKTSERRLGFFSNFLNWATSSKPVVITLLIVGKTQVGKSSFIKRIYGELNKSQEKVDIPIGGEG